MKTGMVNAERQAMVPVVVRGSTGQEQKVLCLLATGFSGGLMLPPETVAELGLPQVGTKIIPYPTIGAVEAPVHRAQVLLAGEEQTLDVVANGLRPVLGLAPFRGLRLRIEMRDGGVIEIERP